MENKIINLNNKEKEFEKKSNSEKRENYINILNEYREINNNLDDNNIIKNPINSIISSIECKKDCLNYDDMNDKNLENSFANIIFNNIKLKKEQESKVIKINTKIDNQEKKETTLVKDFEIIEKSNTKQILEKIQLFKSNQKETFSIKDGEKIYRFWNSLKNIENKLNSENFKKNPDNLNKLEKLKNQVNTIREEYSKLFKKYEQKQNYFNIKKN